MLDALAHDLAVMGAGEDIEGFFEAVEFLFADDGALAPVGGGDFDAAVVASGAFQQAYEVGLKGGGVEGQEQAVIGHKYSLPGSTIGSPN